MRMSKRVASPLSPLSFSNNFYSAAIMDICDLEIVLIESALDQVERLFYEKLWLRSKLIINIPSREN